MRNPLSRSITSCGKKLRSKTARPRRSRPTKLALEALEARLVLDSTVVFSEIMYHPVDNAPEMEWIELYNQMGVDMDLSSWRLDGGVDFQFPEGTIIPGGGYLVIASDAAALATASGFADALGPFVGRLDNGGEEIRLLDNDDRVMNTLDYRDSGSWPVAPDGSGVSLAKADPDTASEPASSWRASIEVGGTPGELNFAGSVPVFQTVIETGDEASYLVPTDDSLGTDWTTAGFDDSAWDSGPTGIGYDTFSLDYATEVLADSPTGYWRFEETSGATAFDSSGNGNDATVNGGVTLGTGGVLPGADDSAARFDGSTGFVQLPGSWGGTDWTELTIEAWVNTADPITGTFQAIVAGHDPSTFAHFQLNGAGNSGIYTTSGFVATPIVPATPTGQWRYVVMTSKSGESKMYLDGQLVGGSIATTYANILESSNVSIGLGHAGGRWFKGQIDEVAIYDRALSQERILTHFLAGGRGQVDPDPEPEPTSAELLARWTFDSDATDTTGNNDGTLGGGATITTDAVLGDGALDLRGTDGYVDIPTTVLNAEDSFSIAYWVAADSLTALGFSSVYSNDGFSAGELRVNIVTDTGAVELGIKGNSAFPTSTGTITADSQWVHVATTYDSATGAITNYFNGQAEPGVTLETAGPVGLGPSTIGAWDASGGGLYTRFLDGRIDDLQIYRGVLTADEVSALAVIPQASQLLAYWPFDTDATDAAGNNNGTLQGGATITAESAVGAGALDLRDISGYVDIPTAALDGNTDFTVALFVSVDSLTNGCCSALFANDSWSGGKLHLNVATSGVPEFAVNGNDPGTAWTRNEAIATDGTWVHLAYTYNASTGIVTPYVNGVAGTPGTGATSAVGVGSATIGAWDTSGSNTQDRFLDGRIDDFRIYSGALTAAEIAELAAAGAAPAPDAANAPVGAANAPTAGAANLPISAFGVISTDIEAAALGVNASAYFRVPFNVASAAAIDQLILKMKYDDGFVAYINGVEVARRNAPVSLSFDSSAAAERSNSAAVVFERFDLAGSIGSLQNGANVLAIQGLNLAADDADFLISPELIIHEADIEEVSLAINEVAGANEAEFAIELANYGTTDLQLGGFIIANSTDIQGGYTLPVQSLSAGGFLTIPQTDLGFDPITGDRVFLYTPDRRGVVDAARVRATSRGRSPDAVGDWLRPDVATPNAANSFNFRDEIVINEIMFQAPGTPGDPGTPGTPAQYDITTFLPIDANWKYEASGTDLGTTWRETAFDDTLWAGGPGLLGFETSPQSLPEAIGTTVPPGSQLTYYFRTEFEFSGDPNTIDLQMRTVIDDGAVIYLNGQEIQRIGVAAGPVTFDMTSNRIVPNAAYEGPFTVPTDSLVVGTNILAVEIHQQATTSSDMILGIELTDGEKILVTPAIPGTSGTPYSANDEEWIELYNRSDQTVDISGWRLDGGIDYQFDQGVAIAAGEYLVVSRDAANLAVKYPNIDIVGNYSGRLGNSSDTVRLEDAIGNPADEVTYFDGGRWNANADGAGSSLELIDPDSDNSLAEAWTASDEANPDWTTISYEGFAIKDIGPANFNELIIGMLDAGEVLIDDISVIENPGTAQARQLIQNGDFESGTADRWRLLGNHSGSGVIVDPDDPANQVLRFVSTGPMEHLGNHAETTLKDGDTFVTIRSGSEYEISLRARWLGGSRQLRTNLYFNRLPRVTILDAPTQNGTPGEQNSRYQENVGPTYRDFAHANVVPAAGEPVTVSVAAADPQGVASMTLWYSVDGGAFNSAPMNTGSGDTFSGVVPGQSASRVVQFYVEGTDSLGATSTFPADGADSRALYKVQDNQAQLGQIHNFRIIMTPADTTLLHTNTNLMSNDMLGATVIYDENQVFYDVGVRLKGSTYGRPFDQFVSYTVQFQSDNLFRGVHASVAIDRSARGPVGSPNVDEQLIKQALNHAGGVASNYNDIIRVIAPRSANTSVALLNMARYGDVFLDSQFENGGDFPVFEFDGAYYLTRTIDGTPEGLKVVEPGPISYTDIRDLGDEKELYRNNWIIKDNRDEDNFEDIIAFNKAFSLTGSALDAVIGDVIDVDQWARNYAMLSLTGIGDTYTHGNPHNLRVYKRPSDGRFISLPHDMDSSFRRSTSAPLMGGSNWNLVKIFQRPQYIRLFYGNLQNLIETTYNTDYMRQWTENYGDLAGSSFAGILSYIGARASFVTSQLGNVAPQIPFTITTNGGADFSVDDVSVTLTGDGWIDIDEIRLSLSDQPLDVTWTDQDSWQLTLPIAPGANALSLTVLDREGSVVGSDTITVTSTLSERPLVDLLRISELMYNPANPTPAEVAAGFTDSDLFEFLELVNTSDTLTLNLDGARLSDGVDFTFPVGTSLAPGERTVVVSSSAAFAQRYGSEITVAGQYSGNLRNSGENVILLDASGATIHDFTYFDNEPLWHPSTDGDGPSLVIRDLTASASTWGDGTAWRPSFQNGGSPGAADAPSADVNGDLRVGLLDLAIAESNIGIAAGAQLADGDVSGDGAVSRADVVGILRGFGIGSDQPALSPSAAASALTVTISPAQTTLLRPSRSSARAIRTTRILRQSLATTAERHSNQISTESQRPLSTDRLQATGRRLRLSRVAVDALMTIDN